MNEMTKTPLIHQGGFVKKTLLVAVIAAMLIFAFAGTALAAVNRSGQQFLGSAPSPSATPTQGVNTNVYMNWQSISQLPQATTTATGALGDNWDVSLAGNTPHGNYLTTTVKCVVCHSVHYAAPGNAPVSGGDFNNGAQVADTLLRVRADQACVYCHATAGMAVNGRPVYDGSMPSPYTATAGHVTGDNCSLCHTTVHGVDQDNSVAALSGYLLRTLPANATVGTSAASPNPTVNMITAIDAIDQNAQGQGFAAGQALGDTTGNWASISDDSHKWKAVGIFCAECHAGSYSQVAAGAIANVQDFDMSAGGYSGHRIGAAAQTGTWNDPLSTTGKISSSAISAGTVAWKPAEDCRDCHATNDIYGNTAFPHSWGGSKMWLISGADASGMYDSLLPINADPAAGADKTDVQLYDGVCLRCHVESGSTAGVGITY
jgi:hypothetical protein